MATYLANVPELTVPSSGVPYGLRSGSQALVIPGVAEVPVAENETGALYAVPVDHLAEATKLIYCLFLPAR